MIGQNCVLIRVPESVCLQGNLVEKDFNIKSLASGIPRRAVQREYKARVSENYLEIHFFWAGKGTCCVPSQGTYGPLISAISATPGKTIKDFLLSVWLIFINPTLKST